MKKTLIICGLVTLLFMLFVPIALAGQPIREDTATTLVIGPFLDTTDGTPETGLTITQAHVYLSKSGTITFATKNDSSPCSHLGLGFYGCPIDTTDSGDAGILKIAVDFTADSVNFVYNEFEVWSTNSYDSLILGSLFL